MIETGTSKEVREHLASDSETPALLCECDYRALFDAAPTPLLAVAPPDWIIVAANEARLRVTGTVREDQIGHRLFDAFPDDPDDPTADGVRNLTASLQRAISTRVADTMPVQRYAVRNGEGVFEERWWNPVNTPVLGENGEVVLVIHQVEDVTEIVRLRGEAAGRDRLARDQEEIIDRLRKAEAELRESEEFNRRVLASSADCIKVLDIDGNVEFMSEGGMCVMEVDDFSAIQGAYWPGFWQGEEHFKALQAVEDAKRGATSRFQGFATTMKGSPRWWDVIVTLMNGSDGEPGKLLSISRDVTGTRRAEDARQASEERLRELNATLERKVEERTAERDRVWRIARDLLVVVGADGIFRAVNPAWRAILGHEHDDVVGRSFLEFVWPDDAEKTQGGLDDAMAARNLTNFENRYTHKDGSYRWISWVTSMEGDLVYALGRDITEEKARDAELEMAQEALRQAQKMEAMGQLTGGVAHDFNNLLTPIVGSLDMLQRKGVGGEREQKLIAGAMQSAERAKILVQRLLAFARRQPLQSVPVDMAKLVTGMGELIASTTGPQIKVVVDAPDGLPFAKADPNQLEMALLNLSVNARDAMPDGGTLRISVAMGKVTKRTAGGLKPGEYIRMSVADTGTGMDEATLARAVEPFFSTKGVGKGTGLGLSMVHGLASQLGGTMKISSRVGLGTNVELWLPQTDALPEAAAPVQQPAEPATRGRALLVDDEETVRLSTADMLAELGYGVIEAASAEEAMRLLHAGERFDLLVTDHLMPGMSGTDLAREVRAARPGMPVLLVSGYAEREGIAADIPRLIKPFRRDELAASLAQL